MGGRDHNGQVSVTPEEPGTNRSSVSRRSFSSVLIGVLALVLVAVLYWATHQETTVAAPLAATSTTTSPPRTDTLDMLVPDIVGTLHAVEGSERLALISWDSDGPPSIDAGLPEGRPGQIAVDASGQFLAVTILEDASSTGTLVIGDQSAISPVAMETSSFAWHMTEPGSMAAIRVSKTSGRADLVRLRVESGELSAVEPIVTADPHDVVLAWGRWGFVLQKHEGGNSRIELLDSAGSPVWSRPAHWAYASPTGDLLLSFSNNEIREFHRVELGSQTDAPGAWFELPSLGVTGVGWSPEGEDLAVVSYPGGTARSLLEIYDGAGALVRRVPLDWHVWDVRWSQDGRFLVMPGIRQQSNSVLFYDVERALLTPVTFDDPIRIALLAE